MNGKPSFQRVEAADHLPLSTKILRTGSWTLALLGVFMLVARDVRQSIAFHRGLTINGGAIWGRDFVNVYTSGRLVLAHQLQRLYDIPAYRAWQQSLFPGQLNTHNYSYPPLTLLYTPLFSMIPYLLALAIWLGGTLALFAFAARPYLVRAGLPVWLAALCPATLICLWAGHYGLLIGALWLWAWRDLERRPLRAGVWIGLMVIKPHMAILLPIMLLKRRAWRTFAAATSTVALLVAASLLLYGSQLWVDWLTKTSGAQLNMVTSTHTFFFTMMPTLAPALFGYGVPLKMVLILQGGCAVIASMLLWRNLPNDNMDAAFAVGAATFLVLPYAFNYDMTVPGLGALILLNSAARKLLNWQVAAAALAMAIPVTCMALNPAGLYLGPVAMALLMMIYLSRDVIQRDHAAPAAAAGAH